MSNYKYIVTSSFGNDSCALIQYMYENYRDEFCVLYNDTGWARDDWPARVKMISQRCFEFGIHVYQTKSEGMVNLVKRKKGWPMPASAMQWCTQELKEKPSLEVYQKYDPTILSLSVGGVVKELAAIADNTLPYTALLKQRDKKTGDLVNDCSHSVVSGGDLIVVTGRRREESQNRANLPLLQLCSIKHGGRDVYNPLANYTVEMRDELLASFGLLPLPHSSMECYPCVCANKDDLAAMPLGDPKIDFIELLEIDMGFTRNGKPRTMFRPYRVGGGVGIRQAVAWGRGERGYKSDFVPNQYKEPLTQHEMFEGVSDVAYDIETKAGREMAKQCDGGFCGS